MKDKIKELEERLNKINDLIYVRGVSLGSDTYFEIRALCTKHLTDKTDAMLKHREEKEMEG